MANHEHAQPGEHAQAAGTQKDQGIERSAPAVPERSEQQTQSANPFSLMRRFSEDMDRLFGGFFGSLPSRWADSAWPASLAATSYWPELEVEHEGGKFIVRADLPGMKQEDVNVEVRGRELCISGERKTESERNEAGYYRSERSYGSFCRTIPLPEGAKLDSASATFENGVLKIELEAPSSEQSRARRIEVRSDGTH